jgi:hypothetical protein
MIEREASSEGLTGDLGVGVGELAADDDLIRLHPVEIATGLVVLAEEVADEPLGTLVLVLEVGGELGVGVPIEIGKWSDADLKCNISKEREVSYPRRRRSGGGALEEPSPVHLLLAICSEEERKAGVFGEAKGRRRQGRLWPIEKLQCRWGNL